MPSDLIPLAEQTGLIVPIGKWALVEACRRARCWRELQPERPLLVAINVSARQLRDSDFGSLLWRVLAEENLPPSLLTLEVTEDALGEDIEATTAFLRTLKGVEVQVELDDFGIGYSSLGRIRQLPLDVINIDRSFVAELGAHVHDRAIVRAIAGLARDLGLILTAGGIETTEQARVQREVGCTRGQGFCFSPALPASGAERLLQSDAGPRLRAVANRPLDRHPLLSVHRCASSSGTWSFDTDVASSLR
ncbi:MAG: hypothetical protein QOG89_1620 [Thermomicrobiales bacterium]|nr:hypothetical protein [Thermomicrobiales bacterium]